MHEGNVHAAIKLLTSNMENGILPINKDTLYLLKQKHRIDKVAHESVLLTDTSQGVQPLKFESISAESIRKGAIKTKGGSGPSGMDGDWWRKIILYPHKYKSCTCVSAYSLRQESRLKNYWCWWNLRRMIWKVIISAIKEEVISSVGSLQIRADHRAGYEAAIYTIYSIFKDENTDIVLLIDGFNSLNREAFMNNVKIICPPFATFVSNCDSSSPGLFIIGGGELKPTEGTTQRDPIGIS